MEMLRLIKNANVEVIFSDKETANVLNEVFCKVLTKEDRTVSNTVVVFQVGYKNR